MICVWPPTAPTRRRAPRRACGAAALGSLARALAETSGLVPTLHEIVARSLELVPCDWAAVAVAEHFTDRPARLNASTDEALMAAVAQIAGQVGDSPGLAAFAKVDCRLLQRPRFRDPFRRLRPKILSRTDIRSVLSVPLRMNDLALGVLTLYSARPGAFDLEAISRASLVAEHAAIAVEAARSDDRADHLEAALAHSRTIGAAIGILVERHRIVPEDAFRQLRETSQHTNRKLADVAADLVETGALPEG